MKGLASRSLVVEPYPEVTEVPRVDDLSEVLLLSLLCPHDLHLLSSAAKERALARSKMINKIDLKRPEKRKRNQTPITQVDFSRMILTQYSPSQMHTLLILGVVAILLIGHLHIHRSALRGHAVSIQTTSLLLEGKLLFAHLHTLSLLIVVPPVNLIVVGHVAATQLLVNVILLPDVGPIHLIKLLAHLLVALLLLDDLHLLLHLGQLLLNIVDLLVISSGWGLLDLLRRCVAWLLVDLRLDDWLLDDHWLGHDNWLLDDLWLHWVSVHRLLPHHRLSTHHWLLTHHGLHA